MKYLDVWSPVVVWRTRHDPSPMRASLPVAVVLLCARRVHAQYDDATDDVPAPDSKGLLHAGEECHHGCWAGMPNNGSGLCPTNFCGDNGACCRRGLSQFPCNGVVGCTAHQCCTRIPKQPPSPPPPPAPRPPPPAPLSECAIMRISYAVVEGRHDEMGDKLFKAVVGVEPWHPDAYVILTYKQRGLDTGHEMPIHVTESEGASLASMRQEADPHGDAEVEYRLLQFKLGEPVLTACESAAVRTGTAGDIVAQAAYEREAQAQALQQQQAEQQAYVAAAGPADGDEWRRRRELGVHAGVCRRGEFNFWAHGEVRKDLVRIGCHLAYGAPPPPYVAPRLVVLSPPLPPPPPPPPPPLAVLPAFGLAAEKYVEPTFADFIAGKEAPPPPPPGPAQMWGAGRITLMVLFLVGVLVGTAMAAHRLASAMANRQVTIVSAAEEQDEDDEGMHGGADDDAGADAAAKGGWGENGGPVPRAKPGRKALTTNGASRDAKLTAAEGSREGLLGETRGGDESPEGSIVGSVRSARLNNVKIPSLTSLD